MLFFTLVCSDFALVFLAGPAARKPKTRMWIAETETSAPVDVTVSPDWTVQADVIKGYFYGDSAYDLTLDGELLEPDENRNAKLSLELIKKAVNKKTPAIISASKFDF